MITTALCSTLFPTVVGSEDEETDAELINEFLGSGKPETVPIVSEKLDKGKDPNVLSLQSSNQGIQKIPAGDSSETSSEEILKESKPCECVKYFLCNIDNGTVVDNGDVLGLIDIRLGASRPSPCPHYFDICCQVISTTIIITIQ